MGVRFDCASSILLCAEDNSSILDSDDENGGVDDNNGQLGLSKKAEGKSGGLICGQRCDFYGGLLMGFPLQSDESLNLMIERECEFLPRADYAKRLIDGELDVSVRRDAIDWISKVHSYYRFGPMTAYLSINYLDRFFSVYELPKGKAWMTQLLSVACLSLAAKMEETDVPLILDLQVGDAKYVFEAKTIQRMELLVLSTLKWRMQAVTPFAFIDHFLDKYNNGNFQMMTLVSRTIDLILSSIRGIGLLGFRASEVAAAVALVSVREVQAMEADIPLTSCIPVEKERVLRCYEAIQEMGLMKKRHPKEPNASSSSSSSSVPQSPIGVLDAASLSYKSDDNTTVGSQPESQNSSPAAKRRKL